MRHLKRTAKLGRTSEHRNAMLANLVCSLIRHKRVTTTLAKAKAARSVAEKMVTLGKTGTIHAKRLAAARLRHHSQRVIPKEERAETSKNDIVRILFDEIAPAFKDRPGGYTRILKLHRRNGDAAELAILEWVDFTAPAAAPEKKEAPATETKPEAEAKPAEAKAEEPAPAEEKK
ncbi:MAG: 50S ribosomal protein L17 [Verrucomicrobiota bacterium]|jgi:large subunit ribosomal protein L17